MVLVYANRDERSVIFGAALRELVDKYPDRLTVVHWLESVQGLPSRAALAQLAAPYTDRQVFICGPGPFMQAAREALDACGVPAEQVHLEVFKSLDSDPFAAVKIADAPEGEQSAAERRERAAVGARVHRSRLRLIAVRCARSRVPRRPRWFETD